MYYTVNAEDAGGNKGRNVSKLMLFSDAYLVSPSEPKCPAGKEH